MIWHGDLRERIIAAQDDMAAHLPDEPVTDPLQRLLAGATGDHWKVSHAKSPVQTVTR